MKIEKIDKPRFRSVYLNDLKDDITGINRNIKDCTIEEALASFSKYNNPKRKKRDYTNQTKRGYDK